MSGEAYIVDYDGFTHTIAINDDNRIGIGTQHIGVKLYVQSPIDKSKALLDLKSLTEGQQFELEAQRLENKFVW